MSSTPIRESQSDGLFRSAWAGLEPLWLVFWVYGALGGNILSYVFVEASEVLPWYLGLLLFVLVIAFYVWVNVAIWLRHELQSVVAFPSARHGRAHHPDSPLVLLERVQ